MRIADRRAKVAELAATYKQREIAEILGISRATVGHDLLAMGVRTSDPRGGRTKHTQKINCSMCGKEIILQGSHLRTYKKGKKPCCSYECVYELAREWALNYDGYKSGPEANSWRHGFYSGPALEARMTIAAINRHIKAGASK